MTIKLLTKDQWKQFVEALIAENKVFGVQEKEPRFYTFGPLSSALDLRLDYDVTYLSPKKYFQPPRETLLKFTTGPKVQTEQVIKNEPFVVLGIHPYDLKAINQMDKVFEKDNADANYLNRRKNATIIACDPVKATKWSFWASMDASNVDKGFDLYLTDIGDSYTIEVGTDKGSKLLAKHAKAIDATAEQIAKRDEVRKNLKNLCSKDRKVNVPTNQIPKLVTKSLDHPIWKENADKCYSCGTCNTMCPTCYCFDVRDEMNLDMKHGRRIRFWDGCLLEDFASVGSGENFREKKEERFRHRILRKSTYVPQLINDEIACVGCGRCSSACLPDIADPVKIFNKLAEEK